MKSGNGFLRRVAVFACAGILWPAIAGLAFSSDDDRLKIIADGYTSNRQAFRRYVCKYQILFGQAKSLSQAIQGEYQVEASADAYLVADGSNVRFRLSVDMSKMHPIPLGKNITGVPFMPVDYLTDGELELNYVPPAGAATLHTPEDRIGIDLNPFGMLFMSKNEEWNPARVIEDTFSRGRKWRFEDSPTTGDKETAKVSFDWSPRSTDFYTFDIQHGFLPREVTLFEPGTKKRMFDIRMISSKEYRGTGWYPESTIWVCYLPDGTLKVRQIKVQDMKVPESVSDAEFAIDLPPDVKVCDQKDPSHTFRMAGSRRIGIRDLASLLERCKNQGYTPRTSSESTQSRARSVLVLLFLGSVVTLCTIIVFRYVRRKGST